MDHANIAKVLDAGTTSSGHPYFVMELVKGVPITEFCDKNHLTPDARLKLFADVCRAIHHAHQKGIIHRDIKPSNVMVTLQDGVGVVKVIDFGVAKATAQKLTEKTLFTAYGQMVGTPEYMSPEQAEMSGLDIDTRTDVYSLGVLLYELLTGTTPLEAKQLREAGFANMQRMIQEEQPPRPSTRLSSLRDTATVVAGNRGLEPKRLVQLVAGDLDCVVMKALEKDRNRRYASPASFADDIERYLRNEPIQARPPSVAYRLKKLGQRHRATILTVCAVTLLVAIAVSTIEALRASRADKAAVAEQPGLMLDSKEAEEQEGPFSQRLERYKSMDIGEEKMVNMMALLGPFFYITNPSYAKEIKDGRVVPLVVPDETGSKIIINMEEVIKTIARDAITFPLLPAAQVQEMNEHTVVDEDTRYRLYRHTCQLKLLGDIQAHSSAAMRPKEGNYIYGIEQSVWQGKPPQFKEGWREAVATFYNAVRKMEDKFAEPFGKMHKASEKVFADDEGFADAYEKKKAEQAKAKQPKQHAQRDADKK